MKKVNHNLKLVPYHFFGLVIIIVSCATSKRGTMKYGFNEKESYYSENYLPPQNIEFVFSGNPRYSKYFYTGLEREIQERFTRGKKNISFKYYEMNTHYNPSMDEVKDKSIFVLNINNPEVYAENNGYDRIMRFEFSGELYSTDKFKNEFSFKIIVFAKHDINSRNSAIANYLYRKLSEN